MFCLAACRRLRAKHRGSARSHEPYLCTSSVRARLTLKGKDDKAQAWLPPRDTHTRCRQKPWYAALKPQLVPPSPSPSPPPSSLLHEITAPSCFLAAARSFPSAFPRSRYASSRSLSSSPLKFALTAPLVAPLHHHRHHRHHCHHCHHCPLPPPPQPPPPQPTAVTSSKPNQQPASSSACI